LARALELASPDDVIFITGSLYLVGELRRQCMSRKGGQPGSS
jgi:folylpolyglutamate synthase/dihydropteroate synthase